MRCLAWVDHVEKAISFLLKASHHRLREKMIILHMLVMMVGRYLYSLDWRESQYS
jgi:hypothetical protein